MSSAFCSKSYQCKCKNKDWCAKDYRPELDKYECFEPMTNADKIRQMADEELAKMLGDACPPRHKENRCVRFFQKGLGCQGCWLDWLKQEVQEDE